MESPNPDYRQAVELCFSQAAFVGDVGIVLLDCGPGWCDLVSKLTGTMAVLPRK